MKIVIACDSFKGSATTFTVARQLEAGIKSLCPDFNVVSLPVADGGEGSSAVLSEAFGAKEREVQVSDPLGRRIFAKYSLADELAIIDVAAASGLALLSESELDPLKATSYGSGELILDAINQGAKEIYLGLGGSATNDGGIGMLQALGLSAVDHSGKEIRRGATGLADLSKVDLRGLDPRIRDTKFYGLSDVRNPLSGPDGASFVYGPQKGAQAKDLAELDRTLYRYGLILERISGREIINFPGAGAAGGIGAGIMAILSAEIKPGIETILDLLKFDEVIANADLVITGEGRMDASSLSGKAAVGIAQRAKKQGLPVIAVVGSCELNHDPVYEAGIDLTLAIPNEAMSLETAMSNVNELLFESGKKIVRILRLCDYFK